MSVIVQLADAVVAKLNAGGFSQTFTAVRRYLPVFDLTELAELRVSVVPRGIESELESRSGSRDDVSIDVGVQKRIDPDQPAEIDALMGLVQEIVAALRLHDFESPTARWLSIANEPIYAPDHLLKEHVFTSILTFTYRLWR